MFIIDQTLKQSIFSVGVRDAVVFQAYHI